MVTVKFLVEIEVDNDHVPQRIIDELQHTIGDRLHDINDCTGIISEADYDVDDITVKIIQ